MAEKVTLEEIASALPSQCAPSIVGDPATAVSGVTHDSRLVEQAMVFACVRGRHEDGHEHAADAVSRGAAALVVDHVLEVPGDSGVAQLVVADVRQCLGWVSAAVHGSPSASLDVIGITGTNGKTTTSHLLDSILTAAGRQSVTIGTLTGVRTTPEATELQALLAGFVQRGDDTVVMEVSSHALALHRVDGTEFALGIFTNLGEDHLDLHGSVEAYFRAKARLFEAGRTKVGVVNVDDLYGRLLADSADIDIVGFGRTDADAVRVGPGSIDLRWRGTALSIPIGGEFNVMNVLAAATAADALGIEHSAIGAGLATVTPVPGRFEHVGAGDAAFDVVVDYAHTPEGLASLLASARSLTAGRGRVIVVFGCGGDRDPGKRPRMGSVAATGADMTIVTSDNPRHEEPLAIIDAIVGGVDPSTRDRVIVEPDRGLAIGLAIDTARRDDIVVIAGKGHETTQVTGDRSVAFDDRAVARAALAGRGTKP